MKIASSELQEIHESLSAFGLSDPEQRAYIELLSRGPLTATPLSKMLGVPATTAQSILSRLAKRGVVHVSKRKTRSIYEAKDPSIFRQLAEQTLKEISDSIPLLKKLRAEFSPSSHVRIYERERFTDIFQQALTSKEKLIYEIVSAKEFQVLIGEKFHFSRRRVASSVHLKSLRVEAREIKKYSKDTHLKELRETKFLPRELTFATNVLFWDDAWVAFFSSPEEGTAVVIHSPSICLMMKQIFDLLWSVSRRMETAI